MKPTKNHFYCKGCNRSKMLFATIDEALRFMKFNSDSIGQEKGKKPVRAYYCRYCCGWHVTSKPNPHGRTELIMRFGPEKGEEIYNKILPLVVKGTTIATGLLRKIKMLRHNLKFSTINSDKCGNLINELFDIFEVVIVAQLEDKKTLDNLFAKFSTLCDIFAYKRKMAVALV